MAIFDKSPTHPTHTKRPTEEIIPSMSPSQLKDDIVKHYNLSNADGYHATRTFDEKKYTVVEIAFFVRMCSPATLRAIAKVWDTEVPSVLTSWTAPEGTVYTLDFHGAELLCLALRFPKN